jgi:hypothetical protein
MQLVDTDSKGKIVFKSKSNSYIALTFDELYLARDEIEKAIKHKEEGLPRFFVDKRKY